MSLKWLFAVYTCSWGSSAHWQIARTSDHCCASSGGRREVPVSLWVLQSRCWNAALEPWPQRVCPTATSRLNKMQQTERHKLWKGNKMFQWSIFLIKNDICSTEKKLFFLDDGVWLILGVYSSRGSTNAITRPNTLGKHLRDKQEKRE